MRVADVGTWCNGAMDFLHRFADSALAVIGVLAVWVLAPADLVFGGSELIQVPVGELIFDARVSGPPEGDLIILLHGFPQTSYAFRHQIPLLSGAGFRVVAPDQRGYSPGARPPRVEDYAMEHLVRDVCGIAESLGYDSFHLVGHDWGAAVAWVTATRHPEKVTSLVALSTPHVRAFGEALADSSSAQAARSAYMTDFAAEGSEEAFLADDAARLRTLFDGSSLSADDVAVYVEALGSKPALKAALNWYRAFAVTRPKSPTNPIPKSAGSHIVVPTLYVWGSADPVFGRRAAEASARYVDAPYRFEPLEGVGHWIMEDATERLNGLLLEHFEKWRSRPVEFSASVKTVSLSQALPSRGRLGGVSVGPDGTVYVSNFRAEVWKISPEGKVETLASSLQGSGGNTVDAKGHLLQASFLDGRIIEIDKEGRVRTRVGSGLDGPVGLVSDEVGRLYVCSCRSSSIATVAPDGEVETLAQGEPLDCPNGITWGPDGRLYVVSFNNGDVVRISLDGSMTTIATLPGGSNAHIAFAKGSFFVTQIDKNRIVRVSPNGDAEIFAGTGALGQDDGPVHKATLSRPNGIAFDPNRNILYVNNLVGPWRGEEETLIILRRIDLVPSKGGIPPAPQN